ncbi:MAG: DUF1585 domain-containing protein, partial [Verrucomicrobia bacterium]|nr:DUF1585 domain-containing protein [Verrucomicrobiota bacterium]
LHKGPAFQSFFELRDLIAARDTSFARGFSMVLIEYALGRPLGFRDEPLIEEMVRRTGQKGFATREFVHTLVSSREFQTK